MYPNSNIWDVFWTKQVQMGQNVVGRWQVRGGWQVPLRSLVNARDLQIEYAIVLYETLLLPILIYGNETIL